MAIGTFKGGVHPPTSKGLTKNKAIEIAPIPDTVVLPMLQHIGAPCEPIVKVKEEVKKGQKIGESEAFVSAPIYSSVSGVVKAIEPRPHPSGGKVLSVVIESDGQDEIYDGIKAFSSIESLSPEEIKNIIRESGIVGMGGAGFPTQVKLSPPP
ncbi:MAG: electron transport complex subunit RsxC, partial [Clostridium sp.]|nr:electron transport complex subunit RsxC [Clostridium sp.]